MEMVKLSPVKQTVMLSENSKGYQFHLMYMVDI